MSKQSPNVRSSERITVVAHPQAKQARVTVSFDQIYHVYVTEAPEHGKANQAIRRALAAYLDIAPSCLELTVGQASKHKTFIVQ